MSAFVVDRAHIDVIVRAWQDQVRSNVGPISWWRDGAVHTPDSPDAVGQMLWIENAASVAFRYDEPPEDVVYEQRQIGFSPTPVEALKAIQGLEYQSCEHPDWEESDACRFLAALSHRLIGDLPGYEEAPWAWSDRDLRERLAVTA